MHDRTGHGKSLLFSRLYSHVKGVHDEIGRHLRVDDPPEDSSTALVHERCQVRRSVRGRQVCDVRDPSAIELTGPEIAVEKVGTHRHIVIAVRCFVGAPAVPIPDEAAAPKQVLKPGNTDPNPLLAREFMELAVSGGVVKQSSKAADTCQHDPIADHYSRELMRFPSGRIIPAVQPFVNRWTDAEDAAPLGQCMP